MIYTYKHPVSGEQIDIEQAMCDKHVYIDLEGVEWERVFYVPNAIVQDSINPFSSKQFLDKTGKSDTIGSILDRASEMSERRAEKCGGVDPLKAKAEEDWSKSRLGRKLPSKSKDVNITIDKIKKK